MKRILCLLVALSLGGGIGTASSRAHDVSTQPPLLSKSDKIAIVAPASKVEELKKVLEKASKTFQSWGLEVVLGEYISVNSCNAFAGSDAQRAKDMQWALDDPTIKAIVGMLSQRIVTANNAVVNKQSDMTDMVDTVNVIYQNVLATLPRSQQRTFQNGVFPKLEEFLNAVKAFGERFPEEAE